MRKSIAGVIGMCLVAGMCSVASALTLTCTIAYDAATEKWTITDGGVISTRTGGNTAACKALPPSTPPSLPCRVQRLDLKVTTVTSEFSIDGGTGIDVYSLCSGGAVGLSETIPTIHPSYGANFTSSLINADPNRMASPTNHSPWCNVVYRSTSVPDSHEPWFTLKSTVTCTIVMPDIKYCATQSLFGNPMNLEFEEELLQDQGRLVRY